jgi:TctA family transporter
MELINSLFQGFSTALAWTNLAFCFVGVVLGTLIGVLPGVGPLVTISMLLPFTYTLGPVPALIMLAGIYYGAQYGGSITAILMNMPGEATSIVTTLDGNQMAKQGRGGTALAVAAIGSFIGGTVAIGVIAFGGPQIARLAISFGPPEYFALMLLGVFSCLLLGSGSVLNGIAGILIGLLLSMVGVDPTSGTSRFTFGVPDLMDGIGFVSIAIGFFGLLEVVQNLAEPERASTSVAEIKGRWLSRDEWKESLPAMLRGTGLGSILGILPGAGLVLAPFASYAIEKKIARDPGQFGKGAIQGVAAPEASNNAAAQTSFIPLLSLGIPANAVMALMLSALMVQGILPGPATFTTHPDMFWGLIASMWIGNVMLIVLNLPMVGMWVRLTKTPYRYLLQVIILCCCVGAFSVNNSSFDVYTMALFAVVGYVLWWIRCEVSGLVLAYVLGGPLEQNLRTSLSMGEGSLSVFFHRPIALSLLAMVALMIFVPILRRHGPFSNRSRCRAAPPDAA